MTAASTFVGKKVVIHVPNGIMALQITRALGRADCIFVPMPCGGGEAAEIVRRATPDLVLVDIEPAEMDGLEAIAKASVESGSSLVIITAERRHYAERRARALGARGYICMPFTIDDLRSALEQVLRLTPTASPVDAC